MPAKLNINELQVKELYLQGLSSRQIASKVGCSKRVILLRLKATDCPIRLPHRIKTKAIDLPLVKHLYFDEKLSCGEIAEQLGCSMNTVWRRLHEMGCVVRALPDARKLAIAHGRYHRKYWKGRHLSSQGYVLIKKPEHHLADADGYVPEHRLVWEETHNQLLPEDWVVHHVNGIKSDNRPDNLVAYPRGKHDKVIPMMAEKIRKLEIENRQLRRALEDSQMILYLNEN